MRRVLTGGLTVALLLGATACVRDVDGPAATTVVTTSVPVTDPDATVTPGTPTTDGATDRPVTPLPGLVDPSDAAIDNDPAVVTGQLDNGLTYLVRHNDQPGGHVSLRLAVHAGSADELADETGVAHFLEHMLFNGTEQYPENELIDVLRGFGADFGADINAYTDYDETVYQLDVPNDAESVATAIDVLDQWLSHATLDEAQVLAERGVVLDEWRRATQTVDGRLFDLAAEHYLAGTRYEGRDAIGRDADISEMTPATLRTFYDAWYRPDNAAVVVVGDIDPDTIAEQIGRRFGDAESRTGELPERSPADIAEFTTPAFVLHSDPDQATVDVEVTLPIPTTDGAGTAANRAALLDSVAFDVLVRRLARDAAGGGTPFDDVVPGSNSFVRGLDAPALYAFTDADDVQATLQALLDEYERAYRFGFDEREVAIAVDSLRAGYESALAAENEQQDYELADALAEAFIADTEYPTRRAAAELGLAELDAITPGAVATRFNARYTNTAPQVIVSTPQHDADRMPTEADVLAAIAATPDRDLEPRAARDDLPSALMERPEAVRPDDQRRLSDAGWDLFDPVEYTFPNGVRLISVPNDIVAGEVFLQAISPGGTAMVADDDVIDALFATEIVTASGAGELSRSDLADLASTYDVELSADLQPYTEGWNGRAAVADLEPLFQLVHLRMAEFDVDPIALQQTVEWYRPLVDDPSRDPATASNDALGDTRYRNEPRYDALPTPDAFATLDVDGVSRVWADRYGDASDWTFVFSGDFDPEVLVGLAGSYLATLPGSGEVERPTEITPPPPDGTVTVPVSAGSGATASLEMLFTSPTGRLHPADDAVAAVASAVLTNRVDRVVREQYGDSYSPYAVTWADRDPDPVVLTYVSATGAPERIEAIGMTVVDQLRQLADGDFSDAELAAATAPVVEQYQYVDNGQFLTELIRLALDPDYDVDEYVYEDATEVDRAAVAEWLATHVDIDQYVAVVTTPRS